MLFSPLRQEAATTTKRPIRFPDQMLAGVLVTAVLAAAMLVLTCVVAWYSGPVGPDSPWLQWFVEHRTGPLTAIAKVVSALGDTVTVAIYTLVACALLAWRRHWEPAVLIATAAIGAGLLVYFGKLMIGRDRPPVGYRLVTETNHSYPSGHALGSTVVIGVLVAAALPVLSRAARIAAITFAVVFALAVGVSRLYLGVHWTTDVLAGWLLGACWLTLCLTFRPYLPLVTARIPQRLLRASDG